MSKWEKVKLGDVCDVERGGSPRPIEKFITEDPNGINWIKIGDASPDSKYITETKQKIITSGMKKSRYVQPGDFLLSNSMSFGRPYILKTDGCIHDGWLLLRDKNNFYHKEFLYYVLSSKSIYEKFKSLAVGGVVNNLNSTIVKQVELPFPPKDTQKQIAKTLDTAAELLAMRKQQLAELDSLIKSVFYEMFGDPFENPREWEVCRLSDLAVVTMGQSPNGTSYNEEGIGVPLLNGPTEFGDRHPVEKQWTTQPTKMCQKDDILFCVRGATAGKMNIADKEYCIGRGLAAIRPKFKDSHGFIYLYLLMMNKYLQSTSNGSTFINISKDQLNNLPYLKVDQVTQSNFSDIYYKIEEQKALVKKAIEETQTLFDSLMAEYFED